MKSSQVTKHGYTSLNPPEKLKTKHGYQKMTTHLKSLKEIGLQRRCCTLFSSMQKVLYSNYHVKRGGALPAVITETRYFQKSKIITAGRDQPQVCEE